MKISIISKVKQISHHLQVSLKVSRGLLWILLLIIITFLSRVVLLLATPGTMYYYDSYNYFSQALEFIRSGRLPSIDPPFTLLLGFWIFLFGSISEPLIVARFFSITLAVITSIFLFNLSKKFLGEDFALLTTLLIMMEPMFLSFSITTHNDVFAVMNAILSLNWALSKRKIFYFLGAPTTFMLAVSSKPFLYVVLGIPIILIYLHKILSSHMSKKFKLVLLVGGLVIFSLAPLSPFAQEYYFTQTRFDPIAKAAIFLRPKIIQFVIDQIFVLTSINFIDISFQALFIVGNLFVFYTLLSRYRRKSKVANPGTPEFLPLFMLIIVYLSILVFTIFAVPYQIIQGVVFPILDLNRRYLMWPRFAILWIDTFSLWMIISTIMKQGAIRNEG